MTEHPMTETPPTDHGAGSGASDPAVGDTGHVPDDVAAWIDEHDVVVTEAPSVADVLAEQRFEHDADDASAGSAGSDADAMPVADLVNNVGDDGGAASG